jgi:two-component system nitrate/nitrite response regulator NarL
VEELVKHENDQHNCTIRVLVVDNSQFYKQLLVEVLKRDHTLAVISSDLDSASWMGMVAAEKIDVFVLSAFADEDAQRGFKILKELKESNPGTRAIMLLNSSNPESVLEAFRAGARGVFDHHESPEALYRCIHRVHDGHVWINQDQMSLVLDTLSSAPKPRKLDGNSMNLLSKREADIVRSLTEGLTNKEIAERLGLSQHTIKNHLFRIFDKLGVSNRVELLFMTLSQSSEASPTLAGLLSDPSGDCDPATLAFCEKAAEHGVLSAQLMLARLSWTGKANDSDLASAYLWFSLALDQLNLAKSAVKRAMSPAQLAEAECEVRERLDKWQRVEPSIASQACSKASCGVVA